MQKILSGKMTASKKFKGKDGKPQEAPFFYNEEKKRIMVHYETASMNESAGKKVGKCACGGDICLKSGKYGDYYTCNKDHNRTFVSRVFQKHKIDKKEAIKIFNNEKTDYIQLTSSKGNTYMGKLFLGSEGKLEIEFKPR